MFQEGSVHPSQLRGSVGTQRFGRLQLNMLLTVMDVMPRCVGQVRAPLHRRPAWKHTTKCDRQTYMCESTHTYTHTHSPSLRPQVCSLSDQRGKHVLRETAVRLLPICETPSSFHLSQHTPSCPAASQCVRLMSGNDHVSTQQTAYGVSSL